MKTSPKILKLIIALLTASLLSSCDNKATVIPVPILTTVSASEITENTAKLGGEITSEAGSSVTARGVCWKKDVEPTISDNKTTDGTGIGSFKSMVTGLAAGTTYYLRAYATNATGTGYGNTVTLKTLPAATTITDVDGNSYKTVNIGTQTWMAENLRTISYQSGEGITLVTDASKWSIATYGAYCNYDNDTINGRKYGRLYNWAAISEKKNIAPAGWHIATDAEWTILINYLGGEAVAGAKLKEMELNYWNTPNKGATNESGFAALPGGYRDNEGNYGTIGKNANWWTATENTSSNANFWRANYDDITTQTSYKSKLYGYSVRCVKDQN